MNEQQFWSIIEAGGPGALSDASTQLSAVREELTKLSPEGLREFQRFFNQKLAEAYTWDLWGAAYLINGGCSDDGFHYFREWLVSRGRAIYTAAVENPDTLASHTDPERDDYEFEELGYLPLLVYEDLTGAEMPPAVFNWPTDPKGSRWDFDNDAEIARRLPKLAQAYLE